MPPPGSETELPISVTDLWFRLHLRSPPKSKRERFEDGFKTRSSRARRLLQEEIAHDCTSERDLTTAPSSRRDRHQGPAASLTFEGEILRKRVN